MASTKNYIHNLTPLRGIAALWVLFFHYQVVIVRTLDGGFEGLFEKGYLWVDFFFILSGFIMTHIYGPGFESRVNLQSYRKFLISRFARIYPLHFFLTVFLLIPQCIFLFTDPENAFSGWNSLDKFFGNLLLIHSIGIYDSMSWNVPSWSISAEWLTYLFCPLLFLCFPKNKPVLWTIIYLLSLFVLYILPSFSEHTDNLDLHYDLGFARCVPSFIAGIILYHIYDKGWAQKQFQLDWPFLVAAIWVIAYFIWEGDQAGGIDVLVVPAFALLTISAAHNQARVKTIFEHRFLQRLGELSYSLYLVQGLVIGLALVVFVKPELNGSPREDIDAVWAWGGLLLFSVTCYALSVITYRFIEVPFRSKVKQWLDR